MINRANSRDLLINIVLAFICTTSAAENTFADVLFPPDDFSMGNTAGWDGAGPVVVPDGGPFGDGDEYLEIIATEIGRQGSRAAIFNSSSFWTENTPLSVGVTFDMINFETSSQDMELRLVLFGPDTGSRWTSTEAITIRNDGVWRPYEFSLASDQFTQVLGNATFDETIENLDRIMIRHDDGTPSAQGTPVSAILGIDNITLDLGPCFFGFCDVNGDGTCGVADIDLLMEVVAAGSNDPTVDFNFDGSVDDLDRDFWLGNASESIGLPGPILIGDSNLDGVVNAADLNALAVNWQTDNAKWSGGNFTGSGSNAADLNALALNWQSGVPRASSTTHAVPEPRSAGLAVFALLVLIRLGHKSH